MSLGVQKSWRSWLSRDARESTASYHFESLQDRVFNSGMKKNRPSPIKSKYRDFLFLFFIFYVYFLNLFFSETNIQKINFGR